MTAVLELLCTQDFVLRMVEALKQTLRVDTHSLKHKMISGVFLNVLIRQLCEAFFRHSAKKW